MGFLGDFEGNSIGFLVKAPKLVKTLYRFLLDFYAISKGFLWDFQGSGISKGFLDDFYGISKGFL